ncbi:MAG: hypothetical protein ABFS38_12570 [Bacteroidota bacterium]
MKTNWILLKRSGLIPLIMAVLCLATLSCEKESPLFTGSSLEPEPELTGNVVTQTFMVEPEGTWINLFNGTVYLEFPEGAVTVPTQFNISSFPVHHLDLDGICTDCRGISIENGIPEDSFNKFTKIRMKYSEELPESSLTIYNVSPTIYSAQRINSIGDCCTESSCNMITGSIGKCGFYVVGEN